MKKRGFITTALLMFSIVPNIQAKATNKTKKKTTTTKTSENTGIYTISKNNKSPIVEKKMSEIRKFHAGAGINGTTYEKAKAKTQKKLLTSYSKWRGTKYAWGGDSKNGIDCSALTRRVYREVYNKELPRVSTEQVKTGVKVTKKDLKAGDILFFKTEGRTNHTTVYVGNSLFINASSSKGVTISSLDSPYWKKYYRYGVRVNKNG